MMQITGAKKALALSLLLALLSIGCASSGRTSSTQEGTATSASETATTKDQEESSLAGSYTSTAEEKTAETQTHSSEEAVTQEPGEQEENTTPPVDEETAAAYAEVILRLEEEHGAFEVKPQPGADTQQKHYPQYPAGVFFLKLLDFDGDGTEELITLFHETHDSPLTLTVYGIRDGEAESIFKDKDLDITRFKQDQVNTYPVNEAWLVFAEYENLPCLVVQQNIGGDSFFDCCYMYRDGQAHRWGYEELWKNFGDEAVNWYGGHAESVYPYDLFASSFSWDGDTTKKQIDEVKRTLGMIE